jgi:hypothetical protein
MPTRIIGHFAKRRVVRKITFGGATSLDNYLARTDDSVDWLLRGEEGAAVI